MRLVIGRLACAAALVFSGLSPWTFARAESVANFYHGKTIRFMVGAAAGGGYDLVSRVIASRLSAHIPGNPAIVVENQGAAGGLVMANAMYNSVPRDGTVIGMPTSAVPLEPRLKILTRNGGSANFDVDKFGWLGSAAQLPQVMFFWRGSGVRTLADLKARKVLFASLTGSDSYWLPKIMNSIMGWRLEVIPGYEGFGDVLLALERGEAQGHSAIYANLTAAKPEWLRDGKIIVLLQFGAHRIKALPNVPTAIEIAPTKEDRDMLRFFALKYSMAYSLITPPGVPADRLAALRAAFDATMKDPAYIEAAKKIDLPQNSITGSEEIALIKRIDSAPESAVLKLREIFSASTKK